MQEIESKRKLRASEGAHFFFTLIFLVASGIIEVKHMDDVCNDNVPLLIHFVFYGLIIWGTYLLISIIPRYKNDAIKVFFNFLDICFGLYLFALFIFANVVYYAKDFKHCYAVSPIQAYFTELFLVVTYILFIILGMALLTHVFNRFRKQDNEE